jgi:hypothetical protein
MKQSQEWRPLGNLNVRLHRTLANILNWYCLPGNTIAPFHPEVCLYIWIRSVLFCGQILHCDKKESAVLLKQCGEIDPKWSYFEENMSLNLPYLD